MLIGLAGDLSVLDVLDGVSATSILSQGDVVIVDLTCDGVKDNVLKDGAEADSVVDIGLLLSGEANALSIAATLDVEDTLVGPAVLVVTDQSTLGISRQGGLAGTRQTEEERNIALLTLVGRRVQSQDVVLDRHLVEQNSEDTLLHLTGILSTEDDHLLLAKVDGDGGG